MEECMIGWIGYGLYKFFMVKICLINKLEGRKVLVMF